MQTTLVVLTCIGGLFVLLNNTVMVVEADSAMTVHWMSPQDIDLHAFTIFGGSRDADGHHGGDNIVLGDGSVRFLSDSVDPDRREALITKDQQDDIGGDTP